MYSLCYYIIVLVITLCQISGKVHINDYWCLACVHMLTLQSLVERGSTQEMQLIMRNKYIARHVMDESLAQKAMDMQLELEQDFALTQMMEKFQNVLQGMDFIKVYI